MMRVSWTRHIERGGRCAPGRAAVRARRLSRRQCARGRQGDRRLRSDLTWHLRACEEAGGGRRDDRGLERENEKGRVLTGWGVSYGQVDGNDALRETVSTV